VIAGASTLHGLRRALSGRWSVSRPLVDLQGCLGSFALGAAVRRKRQALPTPFGGMKRIRNTGRDRAFMSVFYMETKHVSRQRDATRFETGS